MLVEIICLIALCGSFYNYKKIMHYYLLSFGYIVFKYHHIRQSGVKIIQCSECKYYFHDKDTVNNGGWNNYCIKCNLDIMFKKQFEPLSFDLPDPSNY